MDRRRSCARIAAFAWRLAAVACLATSASCRGSNSDATQGLIRLEEEWSRASIARDAAALSPFYADEYTFTDGDGVLSTRSEEIKELTQGDFRLKSNDFEHLAVSTYGQVAIVSGGATISGTREDVGRDVHGSYRFTDVFVHRDNRWQCVSSQVSRLQEHE
jgi:ketosteroid isomerase-like protein